MKPSHGCHLENFPCYAFLGYWDSTEKGVYALYQIQMNKGGKFLKKLWCCIEPPCETHMTEINSHYYQLLFLWNCRHFHALTNPRFHLFFLSLQQTPIKYFDTRIKVNKETILQLGTAGSFSTSRDHVSNFMFA